MFDAVHRFTPHADVPDDGALRLVCLPPDHWYSRDESRLAFDSVLDYVRNNGTKPRYRGNRLVFLAAEHSAHGRPLLTSSTIDPQASATRMQSARRLNIDLFQKEQAEERTIRSAPA